VAAPRCQRRSLLRCARRKPALFADLAEDVWKSARRWRIRGSAQVSVGMAASSMRGAGVLDLVRAQLHRGHRARRRHGTSRGYVPGWPGAHTQGATLDELRANLAEVISMLLEDGKPKLEAEYVGTETVQVA
jgi:hypothetical protein